MYYVVVEIEGCVIGIWLHVWVRLLLRIRVEGAMCINRVERMMIGWGGMFGAWKDARGGLGG